MLFSGTCLQTKDSKGRPTTQLVSLHLLTVPIDKSRCRDPFRNLRKQGLPGIPFWLIHHTAFVLLSGVCFIEIRRCVSDSVHQLQLSFPV